MDQINEQKDEQIDANKSVILFSTHCPKCRIIEMKLQQKQIPFEVRDDVDEMRQLGFKTAPYLKVENSLLEFAAAVRWINEQEGDRNI